jgi:hypothetical protein
MTYVLEFCSLKLIFIVRAIFIARVLICMRFCFDLLITVPIMKSKLRNRILSDNVCVREIVTYNFMEIICFSIVLYDFCTLLSHTSKNLTKPAFSLLILAIGA